MRFPWKQFFLSPVCLDCGSFFSDTSLFCKDCYCRHIERSLQKAQSSGIVDSNKHIYLFEWGGGGSEILSQMVYRLKSDHSRQALEFYAALLARRILDSVETTEFSGLIPIPSANRNSVHARLLAEQMSPRLALPVLDVLYKKDTTPQKSLSAEERRSRSSVRLRESQSEEFTPESGGTRKYIFVDDVLTTGESFKQAREATAPAESHLAATLFYRSKVE